MSRIQFSTAFTADKIDDVNAVIRGVSVITSGLIARGHDLEVDNVTLAQMKSCAESKGQVPVKVDHKSGAAAVCGFLTNFRQEENKLKADWFLLESHPQKAQILEVARRMPRGVGLSASFVSPDKPERTKAGKAAARCQELISVDYVTLPAANPDGMFAAKPTRERPLTGAEKVRRALAAVGRGIETGAVSGVAGRAFLIHRRPKLAKIANQLPASGALAGGLLNGALQWRNDRDLAARVTETFFNDARPEYLRLREAVAKNISVPVPGADVVEIAKKPLVRRVGKRLLKIGAGAGLGWTFARLRDDISSAVGFGTGAAQSATENKLRENIADHRARRTNQFKYLPTLGMGTRESEAFARDLRNAKDANDTTFQNTLSLADDRAAIRLIDEEIKKLEEKNTALLKVRDAQERFDRSGRKAALDSELGLAKASQLAAQEAATNSGLVLEPGADLAQVRAGLATTRQKGLNAQLEYDPRSAGRRREGAVADNQIALLDKLVAANAVVENAEASLAALRRDSSSELVRNTQRITDLRARATSSEDARKELQSLEKKNAVLIESVRIVDDEIKREKQLMFERTQRANAAALTKTGLGFDNQINAAVARGDSPEARRLGFVKEIALIEQQIAQARRQGNSAQRIAALETQRVSLTAQRTADQAKFAGDVALERARNQALIERNPKRVREIDDFKARRDQIEQYKLQGLSEAQAIADFDLSVKARRMELPRVTADSLQSVGGGGFSAGNDYPREQVTLTKESVKLLKEIADKVGKPNVMN